MQLVFFEDGVMRKDTNVKTKEPDDYQSKKCYREYLDSQYCRNTYCRITYCRD